MRYIITILLVTLLSKGMAQTRYKTKYQSAVFLEVFATSPIASVNYEYLPFHWNRAFLATRVGLGFVPGSSDQGFTFPLSVTYNFLPGSLKDKIMKRVYTRCNPQPPRIESETFIEAGAGYTFATYTSGEKKDFLFGIIGIRKQVVFNIPANPRVVFVRLLFTPSYITTTHRFEPRGGIGLGVSI